MIQQLLNRHCLKQHLKCRRGFTFFELVVSLALLGILAAIFGMGLVAAMRSYDFSRANVQMSQKGQLAMARITRELMELVNIYDVQPAPNTAIVYSRIINNGGNARIHAFGLQYIQATGLLSLHDLGDLSGPPFPSAANLTAANAFTLVDQVAAFNLQYLQGGDVWSLGTSLQLLSTIRATLSLTRPDNPARTQDFDTLIYLRNNYNSGGAAP